MRGEIVVLAVIVAIAGTGTAVANQPPLADAGLDQEIQRGETVLVDAMGSSDPDGSVRTYEWTVTAPDGGSVSPACPDCRWTRFEPARLGTYTVRLTVTDDDGATRSDRLYVGVRPAPGAGAVPPATGSSTGPGIAPPADGSAGAGGGAGGGPTAPGVSDPAVDPGTVDLTFSTRAPSLATPAEPDGPGRRDIWTVVTISPFGNDVGGVTYYEEPDGETTNTVEMLVDAIPVSVSAP